MGFKPMPHSLEGCCSIQLSYEEKVSHGLHRWWKIKFIILYEVHRKDNQCQNGIKIPKQWCYVTLR